MPPISSFFRRRLVCMYIILSFYSLAQFYMRKKSAKVLRNPYSALITLVLKRIFSPLRLESAMLKLYLSRYDLVTMMNKLYCRFLISYQCRTGDSQSSSLTGEGRKSHSSKACPCLVCGCSTPSGRHT
jgi:hypothetical protein